VVEFLHSKCKALSSNPSTAKKESAKEVISLISYFLSHVVCICGKQHLSIGQHSFSGPGRTIWQFPFLTSLSPPSHTVMSLCGLLVWLAWQMFPFFLWGSHPHTLKVLLYTLVTQVWLISVSCYPSSTVNGLGGT
jgi:hypothetical protein